MTTARTIKQVRELEPGDVYTLDGTLLEVERVETMKRKGGRAQFSIVHHVGAEAAWRQSALQVDMVAA